jgi:PAS domain-containing protein
MKSLNTTLNDDYFNLRKRNSGHMDRKLYWMYILGFIGIFIVIGYLAFEYFIYHEVLEDLSERPLEHIVIFSLVPIFTVMGYAIDKKVQAESQTHLTRSRAEALFDNIGEGVLELDKEFNVLSANKFVLKLTKMKNDDVAGKKCYEVFHGRKEVCGDCPVSVTFLTGNPSYMVHEGRAKDGTKTYVGS